MKAVFKQRIMTNQGADAAETVYSMEPTKAQGILAFVLAPASKSLGFD
jgi:hypothetical protein